MIRTISDSGASLLREVPLFSNLSSENLGLIFQHASCQHYPKNTMVINEGDFSTSFYLIKTGRVKVFLTNRNGREVILSMSHQGAYFGELSLLDNEPRSASVITLEPCVLYVFKKSDFEKLLINNSQISIELLCHLSELVRSLTENVKNLALNTVYRRLIKTLMQLSYKKNGTWVIEETITQQEIANMVGSSREMINKIFSVLIASGYIHKDNKCICILKEFPPELQIK